MYVNILVDIGLEYGVDTYMYFFSILARTDYLFATLKGKYFTLYYMKNSLLKAL